MIVHEKMYSLFPCCPIGRTSLLPVKVLKMQPQWNRLKFNDKEVRPQDDFYNFVNGTWMKTLRFQTIKPVGEALTSLEKIPMLMF